MRLCILVGFLESLCILALTGRKERQLPVWVVVKNELLGKVHTLVLAARVAMLRSKIWTDADL